VKGKGSRTEAKDGERFEIINDSDRFPFREGPGRRPEDDIKSLERMKEGLLSSKNKSINDATKAESEFIETAFRDSTTRKLSATESQSRIPAR
jgi:hypothetical protein